MNICISNNSHEALIVGEKYELLENINKKLVWVVIPCDNNVGYRTIQAYASDFKSVKEHRSGILSEILKP